MKFMRGGMLYDFPIFEKPVEKEMTAIRKKNILFSRFFCFLFRFNVKKAMKNNFFFKRFPNAPPLN